MLEVDAKRRRTPTLSGFAIPREEPPDAPLEENKPGRYATLVHEPEEQRAARKKRISEKPRP